MLGVAAMTTEEDDFADFQAAPPVAPQPVTPQQSGKVYICIQKPFQVLG